MKKCTLITFGFGLVATAAFSAPAIVLVDGGTTGSDSSSTAFGDLSVVPAPSNTDLAQGGGVVLSETSGRSVHDFSGLISPAVFFDGVDSVAYPANLPADFSEDVGNPSVPSAIFQVDFPSATDVGSVVSYAYNWNGGTPDVRGLAPISVEISTDNGSNFNEILAYQPPQGVGPDFLDFLDDSESPGSSIVAGDFAVAVVISDDTSTTLASSVTNIRISVWPSGFGSDYRSALNDLIGIEAVTSPFIAEIDVLSPSDTALFYSGNASVTDWTIFN